MPNWNFNEVDIPVFLNMKANSFAKIIERSFISIILYKKFYIEDDINDDFIYAKAYIKNLKKLFKGFP